MGQNFFGIMYNNFYELNFRRASFNPLKLICSCTCQVDHAEACKYKASQHISIGIPETCQTPAMETFEKETCVRGYHAYRAIWAVTVESLGV